MATEKTHGKDEAQVDAKAGGAAAGGVTGAAIGAVVGGPVGAGIGAVIGAAAGGLGGAAVDYNEAEPGLRREWESSAHAKTQTWDQVSPAYRYAYESHGKPEYRGKSFDEVRTHLKKGWTGQGKYEEHEPAVRTAWERRAQGHLQAGREAVVPVVEEELHVGKRTVEKGGVRVETRVTETPVQEQVHLHEEHVKVERRPVNREATSADVAFKEGTLELRETAEEAVVAKRARVVEEVLISQQGSDRTETVRDTVRKTDVDVQKVNTPAHAVSETKAVAHAKPFETYSSAFQKDYTTRYANSGYTYDQYTPAYRYGYNLAGDTRYHGDWATVEPQARTLWEQKNKGTWQEFKDAVHHAWDAARGKA